jgi:hypothetical protein
VQVEEQENLVSNASMDSIDWDAAGVPGGFRRLRSPRVHHVPPDVATQLMRDQLNRLPMPYADKLEGHLTDLRTLLEADIWEDVQNSVPPYGLMKLLAWLSP